MNNLITIKVFGDIEHKYGPYFRIGYRDKEATFNLLDKDRQPEGDGKIARELTAAMTYIDYYPKPGEIMSWTDLCCTVRDLYLEMRNGTTDND